MSSRLQYKRHSSEADDSPPVDWDEVDQEISRVNPAFRDPRFDSLRHVLNVLSSENAEAEVEELRDQRAHIEELVDAVVEGYHAGFNKSIQNYSQILRLFTESKLQLESLRRSLESAKRRLSAQSRHMSQQWQRHITLSDTLRLLDDIQLVVDVPQKLQRLEENKEWAAAVALLLDGCNKLARQELSRVGALEELKEEMGRRRASLQASIVAELESRIYKLDAPPTPLGNGAAAGAANGEALPGLQLPNCHKRSGSEAGAGQAAAAARAASGWGPAAELASAASGLGALPPAQLPRRPVHRRAHTATGGLLTPLGGLTSLEGHLVDPEVPLPTLVDCLAQIGGVPDAQRVLRKHMPQRFRAAILRALELFPADSRLPRDERYLLHHHRHHSQSLATAATATGPRSPRASGGGGGGRGAQQGAESSVPPEVAATAQALVEHVLGCCLQVFQATVRLLHTLAHAQAPKPSSGLELLLAQQRRWQQAQAAQQAVLQSPGQQGAAGGGGRAMLLEPPPAQLAQQQQQQQQLAPQGPPGERAKAECSAAWDALQCECERLLGAVLDMQQAASPQPALGSGNQADVPGEGWMAAASFLDAGGRGQGVAAAGADTTPGTLTFSLACEVEELLPASSAVAGAAGDGPGSGGPSGQGREVDVGLDAGAVVRQILGGHPGGPALVARLYRPLLQFAEAGEQMLASVAGSGGGSSGGEAAGRQLSHLFSIPWRAATDSGGTDRSRLRAFVETFLRMEFLPSVYVDFRARCSSVLEDPDAFRPRARLRAGPYVAGDQGGRPLLPAALATEQMVEELLGWAALMPPYATHLTGMVENILGRVLDAFQAQLVAAVGGAAAGRLAESVPLVRLMAKEPSATLLGSPVAFFVGGNTDAMESFVSSVIASGFGANDESTERDVLAKLMAERPLPPSALLSAGSDAARLLSLAALSDSLDFVADVIQRCTSSSATSSASSASAGASGAATAAAAAGTPRTDSWQARLMSWAGRGAGLEKGLTEGLAHLVDRYRALAGGCMRVVRLDLLLLVVAHLSELPRSSYVCSEEEAKDVDECIGALARSVGRLDEELCPCLPPAKRAYAFCSLAPAAARVVVWLLPEIRGINHNGVTRMCRMIASLQPALLGVGGSGSAASRPEAARQFDKAKLYYTLLTYSVEGLLATVAEKPHRFSPAEYAALLAASVPERPPATAEQRAALQRTLAEAGAGAGGSKTGSSAVRAAKGSANAALAAFVKAVVKQ